MNNIQYVPSVDSAHCLSGCGESPNPKNGECSCGNFWGFVLNHESLELLEFRGCDRPLNYWRAENAEEFKLLRKVI